MRRVTIKDVAEHAGVSSATVSRTLHNHPRISEATKERVFRAAELLNYRSQLYRGNESLRSIGLVLPTAAEGLFAHPFFVELVRGISTFAQSNGYLTTYGFSGDEQEQLQILERYVRSDAITGLILLAVYQKDACIDFLAGQHVPFTVVGRPEVAGDLVWVDNDNFHAMYDVVNKLVEGGCRRIAFIGGPLEMNVTRDRLEGYRMALANRGVSVDARLVGHAPAFSPRSGYQVMKQLLDGHEPDAVVTTDDFLSLGAVRALEECGIGEIPCVGFNNTRTVSEQAPGLSSVEIYPDQLGREAARLLIEIIDSGSPSENHVIVPTTLVDPERRNQRTP